MMLRTAPRLPEERGKHLHVDILTIGPSVNPLKTGALLLSTTLLILYSCSGTNPADVKGLAQQTGNLKTAPEFTLKDANGSAVKLSDYHGKVVLLNFWATWCGPCKIEIPWFMEFEQQYKNQGFEVLGIAMDDDGWAAVKPYIAEHKINYRVVLGDDAVANLYGGIDSLPTTFVINREGKVADTHVGLIGKDDYISEIKALLNGSNQDALRSNGGNPVAAILSLGAIR
jgi:cytochrome c biogenesis protein CcmG/thiol:disulfide interchange protein DsbE